jgi:hypothetical protein
VWKQESRLGFLAMSSLDSGVCAAAEGRLFLFIRQRYQDKSTDFCIAVYMPFDDFGTYMTKLLPCVFSILLLPVALSARAGDREELRITTIADGNRGNKGGVDIGQAGPSQGDLFVFDQPLMDTRRNDIGTNSGYCVNTNVGIYAQCQWTLTLKDGAFVVAGQEAEQGESVVAVIGATGKYSGFTGEMKTFPNGDGTFTQELMLHRP